MISFSQNKKILIFLIFILSFVLLLLNSQEVFAKYQCCFAGVGFCGGSGTNCPSFGETCSSHIIRNGSPDQCCWGGAVCQAYLPGPAYYCEYDNADWKPNCASSGCFDTRWYYYNGQTACTDSGWSACAWNWTDCSANKCENDYQRYYNGSCTGGSCQYSRQDCDPNPGCVAGTDTRYWGGNCNTGDKSCAWSTYDCNDDNVCSLGYYKDYGCSGGNCVLSSSPCTEACCDAYHGNTAAYCFGGVCYAPSIYTLTVTKTGTGSGTVTSSPSGINCGSTCSASYDSGTSVTLTASAASGSTFVGWSGDCSGTGSCALTMNAAKNVTATFNIPTYTLTVTKAGTGSGTVTSSPTGINCGSTCSASYNSGTSVTLTASPAAGSTFVDWSGDCSGTGSCALTMNAAKNVTANFSPSAVCSGVLNVSSTGTGTCTVTASLSASNCNGQAWTIQDGGTTKCSGTVSGTPYSNTCSSWTVGTGSYTYTLYIGGAPQDSKSITCSATSVTFDFSISISPTSGSVNQGSPISATVSTSLTPGATTQSVSFSVSGLPSGASAPSPVSCSPSCSSVMTISTAASTPVGGPYSINVCGIGGGQTHCVTYGLTITAAGAAITQPSVTTNSATNITKTSATLNGTLNSMGNAVSVLVWFEWGPTTSYGNSTPVQTLSFPGPFSANISGLNSNANYYFKTRAKNGGSW